MGNVGFCYCTSIRLHFEMADYLGHGFVNMTYFSKKTGVKLHLNSYSCKLRMITLHIARARDVYKVFSATSRHRK